VCENSQSDLPGLIVDQSRKAGKVGSSTTDYDDLIVEKPLPHAPVSPSPYAVKGELCLKWVHWTRPVNPFEVFFSGCVNLPAFEKDLAQTAREGMKWPNEGFSND
jgi:hypothetical protein